MRTLKETHQGKVHYRFVEHNSRKFRLTYNNRNGTPLGFDNRFQTQVMVEDGTWKTIAGKDDIGFKVNESYVSNDHQLLAESKLFFKACEKHIMTLY